MSELYRFIYVGAPFRLTVSGDVPTTTEPPNPARVRTASLRSPSSTPPPEVRSPRWPIISRLTARA